MATMTTRAVAISALGGAGCPILNSVLVCIAVVGPLPLLYLPFSDLVNQISPPRRRWGDDGNAVRNAGSAVQ